ncbi:hypothetical protein [Sinomonas sp. P10A9]|uniref:Tripartite tricarboxylate transporter TctB family protein n=1 Tax=Sinomonas puerhi TaxID=3238584 RepID=A0AB39L6B7_9MICC
MQVMLRTVLSRVAAGLGAAAVLLFAATFAVPGDVARGWTYTVGFGCAAAAVVVWAVDVVRRRSERPTAKPTSALGWWSLGLFAAGLVLQFVGSALTFGPEAAEGFARLVSNFVILGFGGWVVAGVLGLVAWFRRRERSLVVLILSVVPAMFVLYFLLGELVSPH